MKLLTAKALAQAKKAWDDLYTKENDFIHRWQRTDADKLRAALKEAGFDEDYIEVMLRQHPREVFRDLGA